MMACCLTFPGGRLTSCMRSTKVSTVGVTTLARRRSSTTVHKPRHLLTIGDLEPKEFIALIQNAAARKSAARANTLPESFKCSLRNKVVAMMMSKRSTRTRVSTEAAIALMGGQSMFLGKEDIQLGVNETLRDSSVVISSMVDCIVARVNKHSDVAGLAEYSSVPVINGMCDFYHPFQAVADFLTMSEAFGRENKTVDLAGLKVAWIGDANNVLFDLAIGGMKLGIDLRVASPEGYKIPDHMRSLIKDTAGRAPNPGTLTETTIPEEAIKDADLLVTDTWVSMGQEQEKARRMKEFAGYQITDDLAKRGGAKPDWKFMHCLPRHPEEVSDDVFYSSRSLAFQEAANRLWAAVSILETFVVNQGEIN